MEPIIRLLRARGKNRLADCIEKNEQKPVRGYSKELNSYSPARPLELEMKDAFRKELFRLGVEKTDKILESLERRRILQTAPHLGATENPRMLAINWLGSLGVPDNEFYVVGMYSGIPFSNNSRPGRINRREESINLFPSSMQDDLVYGSKIPEKLVEVVKTLPEPLKKLLPNAKMGDSYSKWALTVCGNIERKILGKENLIYLDINEVVANYMDEIKKKPGHPMNKIRELNEANLFLAFAPLLFNHFKCFGSFRQVEYLPEYQEKLSGLGFMKEFEVEKVPTASLTTGEFKNKPYPVDIILGEEFTPNPQMLFGEFITNMMTKEWLEKHI
ncbi:hypothetical protein A2933_02545 [Candidatus Nomurabacteria bacterium RIFCSPLOWO2_01_FULL_46_18]|uniref:Uncharacterized protein n=1 Tax=Candidatus Nomurabacteria bacterium RIFCSPLOWO2_01_FULL_46_18 TaxID=1801783 RepID=A0A1F6XEX8_9BACT|nr:MAG: hypothetical protein A2933_02545 [Candidatus Nomurabacteria bacterium RIFCSPLOWO2_01_FULL_46_18]